MPWAPRPWRENRSPAAVSCRAAARSRAVRRGRRCGARRAPGAGARRMTCLRCGCESSERAKFCLECGVALAARCTPGQARRGPRPPRPALRLVHRRLRHARPAGREGATPRLGVEGGLGDRHLSVRVRPDSRPKCPIPIINRRSTGSVQTKIRTCAGIIARPRAHRGALTIVSTPSERGWLSSISSPA